MLIHNVIECWDGRAKVKLDLILTVKVQILQMNEQRPWSVLRGFRVFHKMIISLKQGSPTRGPPSSLTRPAATFVNVRVCMYVCMC